MQKNRYQKVLEGLLATQSFELLGMFTSSESHAALLQSEKEVLAEFFLLHAEHLRQADQSDDAILAALRLACQLIPHQAKVWYRLGQFLIQIDSMASVGEAVEVLQKAITIDDRLFDAHAMLASGYMSYGVLTENGECFHRALKEFAISYDLALHEVSEQFLWQWGLAWCCLAHDSSEPYDWFQALTIFAQVKDRGISSQEFYCDYAQAAYHLSVLTTGDYWGQVCIELYEHVDMQDLDSTHWHIVGSCYHQLFTRTAEKAYFDKARALFADGAGRYDSCDMIIAHSRLLLQGAYCWNEESYAREALLLLSKEQLQTDQPIFWALCAQSVLLLYEGQEELLQAARVSVEQAMACDHWKECYDVWVAKALCSIASGEMLYEEHCFEEAVDLLHQVQQYHPNRALTWHIMGLAYRGLSDACDDHWCLHMALDCFAKAVATGEVQGPIFWNDWGLTLLLQGELFSDPALVREAVLYFQKAWSIHPEQLWRLNESRAMEILGDLTGEDAWYEQSLHILVELTMQHPVDSEVPLRLAMCLLQIGQLREDLESIDSAIEVLREYFHQIIDDAEAWEMLGIAYLHKGLLQEDVSFLFQGEEALSWSVSLGNDQALYHLGCAYSLLGNFSDAIDVLEDAHRLGVLPFVEDIADDEWMAPLLCTPRGAQLLRTLGQSD